MSGATQFYLTTVLVYLGVDVLACWALNLELGVTGVLNFAFVVFQAAGAYTAAVLTLGPDSGNGGFQQYIGGFTLPYPLPLLAAGLVGAVISAPVGLVALRRLRSDYQAVAMLVVSVIATTVATNDVGLVNGSAGLTLIPAPFSNHFGGQASTQYQWFYVVLTAIVCLIIYLFLHRITGSPLGRALRAVRDNEQAAAALGKNVLGLRILSFVIGNVIAAISGAVLVQFIGAWAPSGWLFPETFVFLAAIIIGGLGNNFGAIVGALVLPVGLSEATRLLPPFGRPGLIEALQWVVIGSLILLFLWFWPQGIVPERKRRFGRPSGQRPLVLRLLRPAR
ncbi:MAG: branched-chain amino acid ABC transporter permease [Chloroflexota bacterium]